MPSPCSLLKSASPGWCEAPLKGQVKFELKPEFFSIAHSSRFRFLLQAALRTRLPEKRPPSCLAPLDFSERSCRRFSFFAFFFRLGAAAQYFSFIRSAIYPLFLSSRTFRFSKFVPDSRSVFRLFPLFAASDPVRTLTVCPSSLFLFCSRAATPRLERFQYFSVAVTAHFCR